jgi:DNA-binding NtrC family response regulator
VPILLISGYSEKDLPEGTRERLTGFLAKPFFPDQLLEAVRAALKQGSEVRGQKSEVRSQRSEVN